MADFIHVTQQVPAKPQQRKLNWAKSTKSTFITNGSLMNFLWCSLKVSHDWSASSLAENTRTSTLRWMFYLIQLRTNPSTRLCHRYLFFFSVDVKNHTQKHTHPIQHSEKPLKSWVSSMLRSKFAKCWLVQQQVPSAVPVSAAIQDFQ